MADTTALEQTSPPLDDIKSPLDISKFNAAAAASSPEVVKQQQAILDSQDQLAKSLEDRYANPNWFKVAAGFLKPQLGGFAASLGSASEALGENVESQRAIAPTIQRMRAEVAQGRLGMETNKAQYQALQDYKNRGVNDTNKLQDILSMAPESDIGKAISKKMELDRSNREAVGFGLDVQEKMNNNPSLSLDVLKNPSMEFGRTAEQAAANKQAMNAAVPQGQDPKAWATMGYGDQAKALADAQRKRADIVLEEGQKSSLKADDANKFLDLAAPTRTLAADPELAPLFSLGKNGDLFSQARAFLNAKGGDTNAAVEGLYAAAMDKMKNASPEARAKADELIKNVFRLEVQMRGSLQNPTDVLTVLNSQGSPNMQNSQAGFLGIMDQLGLNAYRDIEEHHMRKKLGVPNNELVDTNLMRQFRNETRKMSVDMAKKSALDSTPSFYYSGTVAEPSATPAAATPSAPAQASATMTGNSEALSMLKRHPQAGGANNASPATTYADIQAEKALRKAAKQTQ